MQSAKFPIHMASRHGIVQAKLIFALIILICPFFVFFHFSNQFLPFALQPDQLFSFFMSLMYCILPYPQDARFLLFICLFSRL